MRQYLKEGFLKGLDTYIGYHYVREIIGRQSQTESGHLVTR